jgi:hypothetical protein
MNIYIGKTSLHLTENNTLGEIDLNEFNSENIKTLIQYDKKVLPGKVVKRTLNAGVKTENTDIVIG